MTLISVVGLETEGLAYAQEEGKGLIKCLSDKKKKQVGASQVKAVGSHGMCPIGRQEGSRKVWGVRPQEQGQLPGASADGRVWIEADAPLRDNCTKPQRWKRPGSDQAFEGGSLSDCFEMFCRDWALREFS